MTEAAFELVPLDKRDRTAFQCGVTALDRYFHSQARQDVSARFAACFILVERATGRIAGYFTLSAGSVKISDVPAELCKGLRNYPQIPVIRLGRLAVDRAFQRRGLGAALLYEAIRKCCQSSAGAWALVVDAKDAGAAAFYAHHGFLPFTAHPLSLMLPMVTAQRLVAG